MNLNLPRKLAAALGAIAVISAVLAASAMADPIVTTGPAEGITVHEEKVTGTIEPTHGAGVTYLFEWGPTGYINNTEVGEIHPGTKGPVNVSATLGGLPVNSSYNYRLIAMEWTEGPSELTFGKNATFTTLQGLYLAGEASGEESKQPKFLATNGYPHSLLMGPRTIGDKFALLRSNGPESTPVVNCANLISTGTLSAASSTITAKPFGWSTASCDEISGQQVKVTSNGCSYQYSLANAGPPYSGSYGITCPEPSQRIEIAVGNSTPICTIKIPPQSVASTVKYTDSRWGESGAAEMKITGEKIQFEKVGFLCSVLPGNGTNGYSAGTLMLR